MKSSATFALEDDGYDQADSREGALQPILHAELGQAVAGVEDQRDDGRAHAIEDRGDPLESTKVHVERTQCCDEHKVRQDERPPSRPRALPTSKVRDEDPDLDGQRPGERLAHGDDLAHLILREPGALDHQLPLHLPN
jgi:hypothetical protein